MGLQLAAVIRDRMSQMGDVQVGVNTGMPAHMENYFKETSQVFEESLQKKSIPSYP